jgi:hypothetical protein
MKKLLFLAMFMFMLLFASYADTATTASVAAKNAFPTDLLDKQFKEALAVTGLDESTTAVEAIAKLLRYVPAANVTKSTITSISSFYLMAVHMPADADPDLVRKLVFIYAFSDYCPNMKLNKDPFSYLESWFFRENYFSAPGLDIDRGACYYGRMLIALLTDNKELLLRTSTEDSGPGLFFAAMDNVKFKPNKSYSALLTLFGSVRSYNPQKFDKLLAGFMVGQGVGGNQDIANFYTAYQKEVSITPFFKNRP